jgi:hypothetical protein
MMGKPDDATEQLALQVAPLVWAVTQACERRNAGRTIGDLSAACEIANPPDLLLGPLAVIWHMRLHSLLYSITKSSPWFSSRFGHIDHRIFALVQMRRRPVVSD